MRELPLQHSRRRHVRGRIDVRQVAARLFREEKEGFSLLFVNLGDPYRPADGASEIMITEIGFVWQYGWVKTCEVSGVEHVVAPELISAAMQHARSGPRDHVHLPTRRAPILWIVLAADHTELRN